MHCEKALKNGQQKIYPKITSKLRFNVLKNWLQANQFDITKCNLMDSSMIYYIILVTVLVTLYNNSKLSSYLIPHFPECTWTDFTLSRPPDDVVSDRSSSRPVFGIQGLLTRRRCICWSSEWIGVRLCQLRWPLEMLMKVRQSVGIGSCLAAVPQLPHPNFPRSAVRLRFDCMGIESCTATVFGGQLGTAAWGISPASIPWSGNAPHPSNMCDTFPHFLSFCARARGNSAHVSIVQVFYDCAYVASCCGARTFRFGWPLFLPSLPFTLPTLPPNWQPSDV